MKRIVDTNYRYSIIYIIHLYWYCIRIMYLYLLTCVVRAFTRLHGARIQYLATGRYFPSSLPILVWPE